MDNLCHTLAGAALAKAGLERRTRYAGATLMIAANLPDLDVLVFATDASMLAFRRGWTHGVIAQALLPVLLTAVMLGIAKARGPGAGGPPLRAGWLLALSYIGVASHMLLDYLNTYGVRLLAPLDWRWFYGDAVFIIDLWLWLVLGAGVYAARRRRTPGPALVALAAAAGYIVTMLLSAQAARQAVADEWRAYRGEAPRALMVGPVPVQPFRREIIVDAGDHYQVGTFSWWPRAIAFDPDAIPKNAHRPEVPLAIQQSPDVRGFVVWARFPFWTVTPIDEGLLVTVADARFMATGDRFAASTVLATEGTEGD